jgi:hypothetical protein
LKLAASYKLEKGLQASGFKLLAERVNVESQTLWTILPTTTINIK